jgi:hypothetical protein
MVVDRLNDPAACDISTLAITLNFRPLFWNIN